LRRKSFVTVTLSQAVRILAVFGLFLTVPGFALEQRFSGLPSGQRGTNVQSQQPPAQTPAPAGQRAGGPGRSDSGAWEWWKDEAVKKEMKLTDKQVRDISRIFDARAREMKPVNDAYQKQRAELDKLARERLVDTSTFSIQVGQVEALRTELSKSRAVMFYAISRQLSAEQHDKLREIRDRQFSGRRGGGPR
jgi:Spy/CpxP family protein refolding chaperone